MNDLPSPSLNSVFSLSTNDKPGNRINVFLPGWGFDGKIIKLQDQVLNWLYPGKVLPPSETIKSLVDYLEVNNIQSITLTGWSMGAYMALDFALQYPEKVSALYLLAIRKSWPEADINKIRSELKADSNSFLKTFYRKCFLGYRKAYDTFRSDFEEYLIADIDIQTLEAGLKYLANYDTETHLPALKDHAFPAHMINGAKDIIVPISEAPANNMIVSVTMDHAGHPIFLEENYPFHLHQRKDNIRNKFSRAAQTYDESAIIQKKIAEKLGESLPPEIPEKILEIGCGTGNYTRILNEHFPGSEITAIDFAEDMLKIARGKVQPGKSIYYLCCDGEKFLHESDKRFDLITSNATMQWFDNLALSCRNMRSLLCGEGRIRLSIFGVESMQEIREGLRKIIGRDVQLPAASFPDQDTLSRIFKPLFKNLEIDEWLSVREYDSMSDLLEHIRKTGTSGWHPGRPLLTRKRIAELEEWFIAEYEKCCITYQVFQISGRRK